MIFLAPLLAVVIAASVPSVPDLNPNHAVISTAIPSSMISPKVVIAPPVITRLNIKWGASTNESGIRGYHLYWGKESGNYTTNLNTGTNLTATASNIVVGTRYFFQSVVINTDDVDDDRSSEICGTVFKFTFAKPVTNVVIQQSANLKQWQDCVDAVQVATNLWFIPCSEQSAFFRGVGNF